MCQHKITTRPLTPQLGAHVDGVLITDEMSEIDVNAIRRALDEHLVVILRGQSLNPQMLRQFTLRFGPLFLHHSDEGVLPVDGVPEVLNMLKEPDGSRLFGGGDWHADVTFRNPCAYVSVLHALELPQLGGDTLFASTVAAFAGLSSGMQRTLRGLRAVHSYDGPNAPDHANQTAVHPVVHRHPTTGDEGLYINRMFATRFENMTSSESRPLIDFLDRHISRPEFTCRVRWSEGNVVMWDNRFTLHYPSNDFTAQRRHLIRCTAMCNEHTATSAVGH